jgi:hypothetical protein
MNQLERSLSNHLALAHVAGVIADYAAQRPRLRLPGGVTYTLDFLVEVEAEELPRAVEVKASWRKRRAGGKVSIAAHWTDDARVKFKVANESYAQQFTFWEVRPLLEEEGGPGWKWTRFENGKKVKQEEGYREI